MSVIHQERRPYGTGRRLVKSVRVHEPDWHAAKARAHKEGFTLSLVTATLIGGYAEGDVTVPRAVAVPRDTPGPPKSRSVRVTGKDWARARERARGEGRTVSEVVASLVMGYAAGELRMPTVEYVYE